MVLAVGGLAAIGIGWLVGLIFPSAELPVFLILSAWWLWIGWRYAGRRDEARRHGGPVDLSNRHRSASNAASALEEWSKASKAAAESDADKLLALINRVAKEIGEAPVAYNNTGEVFIHPRLGALLDEPGNEGLRETLALAGRTQRNPTS